MPRPTKSGPSAPADTTKVRVSDTPPPARLARQVGQAAAAAGGTRGRHARDQAVGGGGVR